MRKQLHQFRPQPSVEPAVKIPPHRTAVSAETSHLCALLFIEMRTLFNVYELAFF
jgi:hypothetical protein